MNHLLLFIGKLGLAVPITVPTGTAKLYVNLNILLFFYYNLYLCLRDMFDCEFETTYKVVWVFLTWLIYFN